MSEKGAWNPGNKYQLYLREIQTILENGEQRTVRDIYYALESRGMPDTLAEASYNNQLSNHLDEPEEYAHPDSLPTNEWLWEFQYEHVLRAVKRGRRARYIDPGQIVDASRLTEYRPQKSYDSPKEFVEDQVVGIESQYEESFWDEANTHVEVWLEKQSLASVFKPICDTMRVRLEATRGDWSDSKVYEATQRIIRYLDDGNDVTILYFGDYNPSGFHAPVAILDTIEYYGLSFTRDFPDSSHREYYDAEHALPAIFHDADGNEVSFNLSRIALTTSQIKQFDLPENPVPSASDKDKTIKESFKKHVSEGMDTNIELNALKEHKRDYLTDLIETAIADQIDADTITRVRDRVEAGQTAIDKAVTIDWTQLAEENNN